MKPTLIASSLIAIATLSLAPAVQAAEGGTYFTVDAGAIFLNDLDTGIGGIDTDAGFGINAAIGYRFADYGFALELNSGYYGADFGGNVQGLNVNGNLDMVPIFANAKFDVPLVGALSLELGAGAGVVYSSADVTATFGPFGATASGDDWSFGAQGLAGLNFAITESVSLKAGYRFLYVDSDDIQGHYVGAGLNFKF